MEPGRVNLPGLLMMKATQDFQSSTLGYVSKGDEIAHDDYGRHLLSIGLAERVTETKNVERKPGKAGEPATDPANYGTKVVENKPGTRKTKTKGNGRGRKRKRSDSTDG